MWSPRTEEEYPRKDNLGRGPAPQGWFRCHRKGRVVDHWLQRLSVVCPSQSWSEVPRQAASEPRLQQAAAGGWAGRHAEGILCWCGWGGSPESDHQVRMGL